MQQRPRADSLPTLSCGRCCRQASTRNCSDPDAFAPTKLDTDQWVESFEAFGAREAVLVAKHACGFCTWPSNATLPDGSRYPYSTAFSSWGGGRGDVVASFVESVTKAGLGAGFYYSLHQLGSHVMDAHNLSAAQIRGVETQQLTELWGRYGAGGNLSEVWFDGKASRGLCTPALLPRARWQPHHPAHYALRPPRAATLRIDASA